MDVQDFDLGRQSSSWRPGVGNRWCLGRVSSSSETTATPAQRQIDGLTSSAKGSDGPGLDCWGCGERGTARQDDHPRNPFASRPSRFLYHLRGRGGCEKIWFRPRVVFDRRETSGHCLAPGSHSVVKFVPSIISSEQPAHWHDRHNLPGSHVWEQLISTSARAGPTWRRSRSLSSNRWPILSCERMQDRARGQ